MTREEATGILLVMPSRADGLGTLQALYRFGEAWHVIVIRYRDNGPLEHDRK